MNKIRLIKKTKKLLKEHEWKLSVPPDLLPPEDKAPLNGALKCFGRVYNRDDFGNKIKSVEKRRCNNPAVKGSFFCKKCGGGNSNALVHGKRSQTESMYQAAFQSNLGSLFDSFLNDPCIMDLRPELAALRTCMNTWLKELTRPKDNRSLKKVLKSIKSIHNEEKTDLEKFILIRELCLSQDSLTDGESIDRMFKMVDTISKVIDRINKSQARDEYILTPDGLKIFLRCVCDILKDNINEEGLKKVKEEMMNISIRTKGNLQKYSDIADTDFKKVE